MKIKTDILKFLLLLATAIPLAACDAFTDKNEECPTGLIVRFVYDYNTVRADLFNDHVGYLHLNVYDSVGLKVAERIVDDPTLLRKPGFYIHIPTSELPDGKYRLQAVAMDKNWEVALSRKGAKYRKTHHADALSEAERLKISLDFNEETLHPLTSIHAVDCSAPLDTLWHTLRVMAHAPTNQLTVPPVDQTRRPYDVYPMEDQLVEVQSGRSTFATVSLIRDTKELHISLRDVDQSSDMDADKYEVRIYDDNAHLLHDNTLHRTDSVMYAPHATWNTDLSATGRSTSMKCSPYPASALRRSAPPSPDTRADDTSLISQAAHFNVMTNRIIYSDKDEECAILHLINKETGKTVALINLPKVLAEGRNAYEIRNYSPQEYLDREYTYHLDFLLKGGQFYYLSVCVDVLSWAKRIQYIDF